MELLIQIKEYVFVVLQISLGMLGIMVTCGLILLAAFGTTMAIGKSIENN